MDAVFLPLADALGASVDQIKLISCLLIAYPLGSLFIRVPSSQPALKHLFSIGVTVFFLLGVFSLWNGFLQLLFSIVGTWLLTSYVQGPMMPWVVFTFVMGHLTINHVIRALYGLSYETFEVTGPQMVLTMKLTTFAWNVWDGRRPQSDLDKWQLQMRVTKFPSLLEFLGYAFYFPGFLVGPYLEYAAYASLIDETSFTLAKGKEGHSYARRRIPDGRKRVAYRKMMVGLFFLGLFVLYNGKFNYSVLLEEWFAKQSYVYRIGYFQICGFFERAKYYAIWTLTEECGASILTGLGFTGYSSSGASLWEGAANVHISMIELSPNFKVLLDSWNMKTNVWLRECIYKRVTPAGKKPGFQSSMLTFATSAFWHGIAGGYYLTFLFGGFVQTAGRLCRTNLRPLFLPVVPPPKITISDSSDKKAAKSVHTASPTTLAKRLYDTAGTICSTLVLNYTAAPFMLLSVSDSLRAWSVLGWYGHVMIGGALAFFYLGGAPFLKRAQNGRVKVAPTGNDDVGNGHVGNGSGTSTPGTPLTVPPLDVALKELDKKLH